jgi:hypothetical protein
MPGASVSRARRLAERSRATSTAATASIKSTVATCRTGSTTSPIQPGSLPSSMKAFGGQSRTQVVPGPGDGKVSASSAVGR